MIASLCYWCYNKGVSDIQTQAIQSKAAHWEITDNNKPVFTWNTIF